MRLFYGQFFSRGDLVFDVGANQGEYSEVFASRGARVVAIEPNPAYSVRLLGLARTRSIVPKFCAVGDHEGSATLNICSQPGFSTLQPEMIDWTKDSPDYLGVQWAAKIDVPILTLDSVAEQHGVPSFVKIDVEGFEYEVICGMSFCPRFVSFEFGVRHKHTALRCIDELGKRGYKFNLIVGRAFTFEFDRWLSARDVADWLVAYSVDRGEFGDILAKL
jgi:FkbM family methyltransferase